MSEWSSSNTLSQRGAKDGWRASGQSQGRGGRRGRGRGGKTQSPISNPLTPPSSHESSSMNMNNSSTRSNPVMDKDYNLRKRMNLMASVSRSSGLEKDGDDTRFTVLKNFRTQEEYRRFIGEKVDEVFKNYIWSPSESESQKKQRVDVQENTLILFRKLREGVASSKRNDDFALEVYETSLYLSALFESPKQIISIIPHLFPPPSTLSISPLQSPPSTYAIMIALLHFLVDKYPSQSHYDQQLDTIPKSLLLSNSEVAIWLKGITMTMRTRNYTKFASLSTKASVLAVTRASSSNLPQVRMSAKGNTDLGLRAVLILVEALRRKVAGTTWNVMRAAYRELWCDNASQTNRWLAQSLCLDSVSNTNSTIDVKEWLDTKVSEGHLRPKEGIEGRWIVCKIR